MGGQIGALGGALASRMQAKILEVIQGMHKELGALDDFRAEFESVSERIGAVEGRVHELERLAEWTEGQAQHWRRDSKELFKALASLTDPEVNDTERFLEMAREDTRTVHLEVMSLDTRLAAIEE